MIEASGKTHTYRDSHDDVYKTLRRLADSGEVHQLGRRENNNYRPTVWSKSDTEQLRADTMDHEFGLTDLYVALKTAFPGECDPWHWTWTDDERHEYGIHARDTFTFDGRTRLRKRWLFFEYDRGGRGMAKLANQIKAYYEFSERFHWIRFHVIYLIDKAEFGKTFTPEQKREFLRTRRLFMLNEFAKYERADQFLVANFDHMVTEPQSPILLSPQAPEKPLSLTQLLPL